MFQIIPDSMCFTGGHLEVNTDQSKVTYKGVELSVFQMTIEIDWEAGLGSHPIVTLNMTIMPSEHGGLQAPD